MRKGNIVILEGSELKVKLLRSIGRKDKDGQFWEIEFTDGSRDVRLLRERVVGENMVANIGIPNKCWKCGEPLDRMETHLRNHDVLVCPKHGEVGLTWWDSFTKLWYYEWQ